MEEVRANVPEEFKDKIDQVIGHLGMYNHRSEYIRDALRTQVRKDAGLIQGVSIDDL